MVKTKNKPVRRVQLVEKLNGKYRSNEALKINDFINKLSHRFSELKIENNTKIDVDLDYDIPFFMTKKKRRILMREIKADLKDANKACFNTGVEIAKIELLCELEEFINDIIDSDLTKQKKKIY